MQITEQIKTRAEEVLNTNQTEKTINKERNIYGAIGEVIAFDTFEGKGLQVKKFNDYNYDLKVSGFKVEVKTKFWKYYRAAKKYSFFLLPSYNFPQNCDYYLIIDIYDDKEEAEILGYISREKAQDLAKPIKAGEVLEGCTIPADSVFIPKKHLQKLRK